MQAVVLASGSQYRARLLGRLGIEFEVMSPNIDETALIDESASELSIRLAREKADKVCQMLSQASPSDGEQSTEGHLIIASDQVACCGSIVLGKPETVEQAKRQLASMSGQCVDFFTSLCILQRPSNRYFTDLDVTQATLRILDEASIERYIAIDKPLDCAGSFKVESMGICLFDSVSSNDPTGLVGLPLIKVCEGLRQFGVQLP